MSKQEEKVKKQFSLNKEIADLIDLASAKTGIKNSQIANNAIEIYLYLFYGEKSDLLRAEIRKICESGGEPWGEETDYLENFSGGVANITKAQPTPVDEKVVIKKACLLFTRLYRENLISKIESKAAELGRSSSATVCEMIRSH
ncbi:hypothetical protein [Candidatus Uabimicrobium sp. HlEnr_7]|uniref:hypothetical protein n=1 Tax=Candidatus Uabimicrobium helgolandensis TaxID=3095367 RepID=UPI00355705B8